MQSCLEGSVTACTRGCPLCRPRPADAVPRAWAAADLRTLARLIPAQSRLLLGAPPPRAAAPSAAAPAEVPAAAGPLVAPRGPPAAAPAGEDVVEVPTASVRAGDLLLVRCRLVFPGPALRWSPSKATTESPDACRTGTAPEPSLPVTRGQRLGLQVLPGTRVQMFCPWSPCSGSALISKEHCLAYALPASARWRC